jgi:hypothetical protein
MAAQVYFCPLCPGSTISYSFSSFHVHIRRYHQHDKPFSIRCELTSLCGSRYSSYDSYKCHLYRCHRDLLDLPSQSQEEPLPTETDANSAHVQPSVPDLAHDEPEREVDDLYDQEILASSSHLPPVSFRGLVQLDDGRVFDLNDFEKHYTQFLLELREGHLLPQNIVQSITSNILYLLDIVSKLLETKAIQPSPDTSFIPVAVLRSVMSRLRSIIVCISKNEYQFLKQCESHFGYEPPREIPLPSTSRPAYYVPIKTSLNTLLKNTEIAHALIDNVNRMARKAAEDSDLIFSFRQVRV